MLRSYGADPYHKCESGYSIIDSVREGYRNDIARGEFADIIDLPDPPRDVPSEEDYRYELWGTRSTTAKYAHEYAQIFDHYLDQVTIQGTLAGDLNAIRVEAQGNGNINRHKKDRFVGFISFIADTLCADPGFTDAQRKQIVADLKAISNIEYPEVEDEPYDRLQDAIVEYIRRHPTPIPHTGNDQAVVDISTTKRAGFLTRLVSWRK